MGENRKIEWCAHTFNSWIGCTKISPACDNCDAAAWDARWGNSWGRCRSGAGCHGGPSGDTSKYLARGGAAQMYHALTHASQRDTSLS
ncbi:DUF5131 family protein [Rhodovulum sulfidophilum]|uniref:DUF5131 family protein n=1 Tax=Rhodovulum sulfidophilum TaxID=35806 RepID=UPI001924A770|nr:DUF5131 family protein [Rhodovulum sulfidophilum]MBL3562497.1 DUF5131 family protein [Rhodovulum sulfidophilum]